MMIDNNDNQPKISVIVPVYNSQTFLKKCLDSIASQDMSDWEAILVDDGSTDSSAEICRKYVNDDPRFNYLYQTNGGPDMARKTGTINASGEYVTYVDADDYIANNALSLMLKTAEDTDADIVCSQIIGFDGKRTWDHSRSSGEFRVLHDKSETLRAYFEDETLIGTYYAKLIKKEIMDSYSFVVDGLIGEDITAALYMFDRAKCVAIITDRLYYYYQNMNSISHSLFDPRHARSLENYIFVRDRLMDSDAVSEDRIAGYFAGYEMAVATAMGRSGKYSRDAGELLRNDLKKHRKYIIRDKKTRAYMKTCIVLYIVYPKLFVALYNIYYRLTGR
ncbi:MAG: glycosyltransferase [Lachnospiraceae bacterium]|nr:glycosyltransferase [Lachnospiraceae bacterium]